MTIDSSANQSIKKYFLSNDTIIQCINTSTQKAAVIEALRSLNWPPEQTKEHTYMDISEGEETEGEK